MDAVDKVVLCVTVKRSHVLFVYRSGVQQVDQGFLHRAERNLCKAYPS